MTTPHPIIGSEITCWSCGKEFDSTDQLKDFLHTDEPLGSAPLTQCTHCGQPQSAT